MYSYLLISAPEQLYFGFSSCPFDQLMVQHRLESTRKWFPFILVNGPNIVHPWKSRAMRLGKGCSGALRAALQVAHEMQLKTVYLNGQIRGEEGSFLGRTRAWRQGDAYVIPWGEVYKEGHAKNHK